MYNGCQGALMKKRKNKDNLSSSVRIFILVLFAFMALVALFLRGADVTLLNPKGLIATEQYKLMIIASVIMLEIAIPTLILFYYFAWKYRETNKKAAYDPRMHQSKFFTFSLWAIPSIIVVLLAYIMWPATHRLAPQKSIESNVKPLTIQVVAMRWKWLFIYPEQNIATVNFVHIPVSTPVQFEISADEAPMSSFWIPHLAGQIYAMTGHVNRLNVMADTPGDYPGSSAEINGSGFAGMKFVTRASSRDSFNQWVETTKESDKTLGASEYQALLAPSKNNPAEYYASVESGLYDAMLNKYEGSHAHESENHTSEY